MTDPFLFHLAVNTSPFMKRKLRRRVEMTAKSERKAEVYDVDQVIKLVKDLSYSQGFYGRLLERILYMKEYEQENFERFKEIIEEQEFKDPVDVVLFFEQ